jgi:hypothetical protein
VFWLLADGNACPAFDIVINTVLFEKKVLQSELYRTFLTVIVIETIEEKFKLELEKSNYTILSHKKVMGKLNPHFVRDQPKIKELKTTQGSIVGATAGGNNHSKTANKPLVEEIDTKELQLDCSITQISSELAKAEVKIPNLVSEGQRFCA